MMPQPEIKIERNKPLPRNRSQGGAEFAAMKRMKVGESFFVPLDRRKSVASNLGYRSGHAGIRITTRTVTENGVKGVRVWRVE